MPEKDTIFKSNIKSQGIFNFSEFYKFCHEWLSDEAQLTIIESKYKEKLDGEAKFIDIEWVAFRKVTDYFKFEIKVTFKILGLTSIEIQRNGKKEKANKGSVQIKVAGTLIRDYEGKFEKTGFNKFLRSIYEKWVIPSRIKEYEDKLAKDSDEFLAQAKAWLDLEGKK
jgi:hypothetical protein